MSGLEVIGIVASCVRAFNNGAENVAGLQAHDSAAGDNGGANGFSPQELWLQEMLQESMNEASLAVSNHFKAEQQALGSHGYLLQKGDVIAKEELLYIVVTLQNEILDKLRRDRDTNSARSVADDLKSLQRTAIAKQHEAIRSITELRQRLLVALPSASSSRHGLGRRDSAESMAASFVASAVDFSRQSSRAGQQRQSRPSVSSLSTIRQDHLIPEIRADDIDALTLAESTYFIAPEAPLTSVSAAVQSRHAPQPRHLAQIPFSSASSMRAADAPESLQRPPVPEVPFERIGPFFPPLRPSPEHAEEDPSIIRSARRDRPSLTKTVPRSDTLPVATRVFSNLSAPSPSSSPGLSEPDSAISIKMHSTKPYCGGAIAAQEDFMAGFIRDRLPVLPGSDMLELCWKCKECDFNASDSEGQLFDRIEFRLGVRFRFKFLAKSHVPYDQPRDALRPRYHYGCLFCTAEGKQSASWHSVDNLMSHIRDKHHTTLTPEVKNKTKCIVGKLAVKTEEWDCNFPDVSAKKGGFSKFMLHALTSLPT